MGKGMYYQLFGSDLHLPWHEHEGARISKALESVRGTYAGASQRIDAEAFVVAKGEVEARRFQARPKLEKELQLQVRYGTVMSIK